MRVLWLCLLAGAGVSIAVTTAGCGSSSSHNGFIAVTAPIISNINGATTPTAAPGSTIVINGNDFGATAGTVDLTQNGTTTTATVASGNWTNTSILAVLPATLAAPGSGSVSVTVVTSGGATSNAVSLILTPASTLTAASVAFSPATTTLPIALRAESAVSVPSSTSGNAFILVIGGNTGTADISSVVIATVSTTGAVTSFSADTSLPTPVALAAVAEADATNAPVPAGAVFVYVIGGQENATDTPGGTSTVYLGTVTTSDGQITWTTTTALPETRVGASAVVYAGYLYVVGGLSTNGAAIARVASAPITSNGTLGTFTETTGSSDLPVPVAFAGTFASGGFLYVLGGDTGPVTNPFSSSASTAIADAFMAPIRNGVVGTWTQTGSLIAPREKFQLFDSGDVVLVYEGAYGATNQEGEASTIGANGELSSFTAQSGGTLPGLDVFDAAGTTSPLISTAKQPQLFILGGESAATPGAYSRTVTISGN